MLILVSCFAAMLVTGTFMLLWANSTAVEGYEDEQGFHLGRSSVELSELEHASH